MNLTSDIVQGIARQLLTVAGTLLASSGVISSTQSEAFVGAGVVLISLIWSVIHKQTQADALDTALLMPAGSTKEQLAEKIAG